MRCAACGTGAVANDRFCHACGAKLTPSCATCGQELLEDDRFCPECGTPTAVTAPPGNATPSSEPAPQPPPPEEPKPRAKPKAKAKPKTKAKPKAAGKKARAARASPKPPPSVAPAAPLRKPNRFWPSARSNGVVLIVFMALGLFIGLAMEDGELGPGLFLMAMVFIMFVIWRNILMGFGFFLTPTAPESPGRAPATPGVVEKAAQEAAEEDAGGKGWGLLGIILVIAGLLLAKTLGKLIGGWLGTIGWAE